jgi:hypothetical protein
MPAGRFPHEGVSSCTAYDCKKYSIKPPADFDANFCSAAERKFIGAQTALNEQISEYVDAARCFLYDYLSKGA